MLNGMQKLQLQHSKEVLTLAHTVCFKILMYRTKVGHSDCVDQLDSCGHNKSHSEQFQLIINTTFKY